MELAKILSLQTFHEECRNQGPRRRQRSVVNDCSRPDYDDDDEDDSRENKQPPRPHSEPNILENGHNLGRIRLGPRVLMQVFAYHKISD